MLRTLTARSRRPRAVRPTCCRLILLALLAGLAGVGLSSAPASAQTAPPRPDVVGGPTPRPASVTGPLTAREGRILRNQRPTAAAAVPSTAVPSTAVVSVSTTVPAGSSSTSGPGRSTAPSSSTTRLATALPSFTASTTSTSTTEAPTSTTSTTIAPRTDGSVGELGADGAIVGQVVLGDGAFVFDAPLRVRPRQKRAGAILKARKEMGKSAPRPITFFALFSAKSPMKVDPVTGRTVPLFDRHPVWVVYYRAVETPRAAPATLRSRGSSTTTTEVPTVRTDVVFVFDDTNGAQILRSEYASA